MSKHSLAEAANRLSDLVEKALRGEEVVITRHGHPLVEVKALAAVPKVLTDEELAWLAERREGGKSRNAAT